MQDLQRVLRHVRPGHDHACGARRKRGPGKRQSQLGPIDPTAHQTEREFPGRQARQQRAGVAIHELETGALVDIAGEAHTVRDLIEHTVLVNRVHHRRITVDPDGVVIVP